MTQDRIGVLGATSMVGGCLLPELTATGTRVMAFSRRPPRSGEQGVDWHQLGTNGATNTPSQTIRQWISLAPIWALPECFALLEAHGAQRIVVLSSTSLFTKQGSNDPQEQAVAQKLARAEAQIAQWAQSRSIEWVILRPTLIYGLGLDKNITEIAGFIRRFGFTFWVPFPIKSIAYVSEVSNLSGYFSRLAIPNVLHPQTLLLNLDG